MQPMLLRDAEIVDDATRREFLGLLAAVGLLAACGGGGGDDAGDEPATRTFVDVTGTEVQVPDRAQRIVATNDQNAGAPLLALGAPVVGIASRDGVIDPSISAYFDVDDIELVGEHFAPNIERIAELRPDLIVHEGYEGAVSLEPATLARLQEIAPVVGIDAFRPIEEVMRDHAELLGGDAPALLAEQASDFEDALAELQAVLGDGWTDVSASLLVTNGDALEAWEPTAIEPLDILSRLGVSWAPLMVEAAKPENGGYISDISLERLPEFTADLVLVDVSFGGDAVLDHPLFLELPAAKAGQVIEIESNESGAHYPGYIALTRRLTDEVRAMSPRTDLV